MVRHSKGAILSWVSLTQNDAAQAKRWQGRLRAGGQQLVAAPGRASTPGATCNIFSQACPFILDRQTAAAVAGGMRLSLALYLSLLNQPCSARTGLANSNKRFPYAERVLPHDI